MEGSPLAGDIGDILHHTFVALVLLGYDVLLEFGMTDGLQPSLQEPLEVVGIMGCSEQSHLVQQITLHWFTNFVDSGVVLLLPDLCISVRLEGIQHAAGILFQRVVGEGHASWFVYVSEPPLLCR